MLVGASYVRVNWFVPQTSFVHFVIFVVLGKDERCRSDPFSITSKCQNSADIQHLLNTSQFTYTLAKYIYTRFFTIPDM